MPFVLSDFETRLEFHGFVRPGGQTQVCGEQDFPKQQQKSDGIIVRKHISAMKLHFIFLSMVWVFFVQKKQLLSIYWLFYILLYLRQCVSVCKIVHVKVCMNDLSIVPHSTLISVSTLGAVTKP